MVYNPDPSADLIDEKGHTREDAAAQVPNLDLDAPAASQETPGTAGQPSGNVMVPAQTPEEVAAQVRNIPGHPDQSHDIDEQMEEAAEFDGDSLDASELDSDADADDEDDEPDASPARNASTQEWVDFAVANGADEDEAAGMTRAELIEKYGADEA
jgi:hypothetical protein